jgi:rhodanese-related sulfurtransferase
MSAGATSECGFDIVPAAKPGITNSVTFTSSDENVATVDAKGKVTVKADAKPDSEVTITATGNATSGSTPDKEGTHKTASYTVKVTADKSYADMTPEEWAAVGIDYADVNYTDDFILDVRTADNYAKGHLVGSTNVSVAAGPIADGDAVAQALDKAYGDAAGKRVVIVCNSGQSLAKRAMDYFKTHGADMSKVTYLKGGNKGIAEGEYALNNGIVSAADIDLSKDVVVDLRPADMYNAGHIVASKNIDVMTQFTDAEKAALDEQMAKVPADGKLVLVCIRGIGLAKKATAYLQSAGADMKKVTYLIGGATALAASEYKSMLGVSEVADTDVVVDVRPEAQYANGRIEGSIECTVSGSITEDQKTALKKVYEDNKDSNIVIVCIKGVGLAKSALSYLQSIGADMTKVTYLVGGFDTWKAKYPYLIGDVLVDPAAKTVEIAATVNSEYTETPEAISHLVLYNETTDKSSPFTTSVKPLDLHAALTALGAVPWSDSARSFDTGMTLNDAEGDNANFTHLDITVDGAPLSDVIKYVKDGVASDSAAAIDMAFSGNKENQTAWNTGCVSCLFSCYAGIVSNSAIGIGTVDAEHNYFYLDTAKLTGGQDVTLVYTLK